MAAVCVCVCVCVCVYVCVQVERLGASGQLPVGEMVRLNALQRADPPSSITHYCMDTDSMDLAAR